MRFYKFRQLQLGLVAALAVVFGLSTPRATPRDYVAPSTGGPWTFCADENSICEFDGTAETAFGDNGNYAWHYAEYDEINCTTTTFGTDPWPGHAKGCWFHHIVPDGSYSYCADENNTCTFTGYSGWVAYGADEYWIFSRQTDEVSCDDTTLGDPDFGTPKTCLFKPDPIPATSAAAASTAKNFFLPLAVPGQRVTALSRTEPLPTRRLAGLQLKTTASAQHALRVR